LSQKSHRYMPGNSVRRTFPMTRTRCVMGVEYIAAIAKDDYETFKTVLTTELPRDYETWLRVRERGKLRALKEGAANVIEVEVTPGEFVDWLERPDFSIGSLDLYALEKAASGGANTVAGSTGRNAIRRSV